jgi:predicted 3-demethylubiquinone-9 3-methyltransferase (glyoxalase superfamily)
MQQPTKGIAPCLWFDGRSEEAARFYVSVFGDARIVDTLRYGEAGPGRDRPGPC